MSGGWEVGERGVGGSRALSAAAAAAFSACPTTHPPRRLAERERRLQDSQRTAAAEAKRARGLENHAKNLVGVVGGWVGGGI